MLLGEQATVQTYFEHRNPGLSWFDGRAALPLPPPGEPATYLIGSSAPLAEWAVEALGRSAQIRDRLTAPDGSAALTVIELPAGAVAGSIPASAFQSPIRFTDQLALTAAQLAPGPDSALWLALAWRTDGLDPAAWPAYRLEVAGERPTRDGPQPWQDDVPFEAFRPPEWVAAGSFLTWHKLDAPNGEMLQRVRLRLLRPDNRQPIIQPGAPDGWHRILP
jgi:hypothetical protein